MDIKKFTRRLLNCKTDSLLNTLNNNFYFLSNQNLIFLDMSICNSNYTQFSELRICILTGKLVMSCMDGGIIQWNTGMQWLCSAARVVSKNSDVNLL